MKRSCGECSLCCKVLGVFAVGKPNLTWCPHCNIGKGCRIYDSRPPECAEFICMWLTDETLPPEFDPMKAKFVTYRHQNNCVVIDCDKAAKNIHLEKKYAALFAKLAAALEPHGGFVSVCYGKQMVAITPKGVYNFGETRATHTIKTIFNPFLRKIDGLMLEKL